MGVLASDTFAGRTVASGWGTASDGVDSWTHQGSTGTFSVGSNEGSMASTTGMALEYLGTDATGNTEVVARMNSNNVANDVQGVYIRGSGSNSWYAAQIDKQTTFRIEKNVAGTQSLVASSAISTTTGTFYWVRLRGVGNNLYAKFWADGSGEPSTWTLTATDSSLTSGQYGIQGNIPGAAANFDNFTAQQAYGMQGQARSTFYTRSVLNGRARSSFYTRAVLKGSARDTFQIRVPLLGKTRSTFLVRTPMLSPTRSKFFVRNIFLGKLRSTFNIRVNLKINGREKFYIRAALYGQARSKFLLRPIFSIGSRSRFFTRNKLALPSWVRFIIRVGSARPYKITFSVVSKYTVKFAEVALSLPNSTVSSTATVQTGAGVLTDGLTASCTVTFPDGTTSTPAVTGVGNGSGQYTITYTTKGPGFCKELWSFSDTNGSILQGYNVNPVTP